MGTTVSHERRTGERRVLVERRAPLIRRSGRDRRQRQRRMAATRVVRRERRTWSERRHFDRRGDADRRAFGRRQGLRRRGTPTPYTAAEVAVIREQHATPGVRPHCPSCNGTFTLGAPKRRAADLVRQVRCTSCGKSIVVTNPACARVIVVAQKEVVRQMIRTVLSEAGHEVLEAGDASVALWAYDQNPADAVFIDVLAPGRLAAGDFVRQLRREHPDARVIAMAGRPSYGVADPLAVARTLGATRTIRMPFSADDLLRALEAARA